MRSGARDDRVMTVDTRPGAPQPVATRQRAREAPSTERRARRRRKLIALGYTLIELMVAVGILGILTAMGVSGYQTYVDRGRTSTAVSDLLDISQRIKSFELANRRLPDGLDEIGRGSAVDPWGTPYRYFNLQTQKGNGMARKRKNLSPLNSDYDLYSLGRDKKTVTQLGHEDSADDVVRALDGRFLGRGEQLDPAASNQ